MSHAVLLTAAQLLRGLLRLFFVVALARVLGPERFGVYALLLAMVEMLAVASGAGYVDYLTREAARDERLGWGLAAQLTWLRAAYLVPFTGVGVGVLWLCRYPRLVLFGTACISLTLIPRSLTEGVQGVLRGTGRQAQFLIIEVVFGLTLAAGAGILLVRGGGLRAAIIAEFAAAACAAVASLTFASKFRTNERIRLNVGQLLKTSTIFNVYASAVNLYDRLDVVLLSRLAGDYATGIYGAAYRVLGTLQLVPNGVLYSLLPALSRGEGGQVDRERLERAMGFLLSAALIVVLATMVFAGPSVHILLGAGYAESATALKILIWAVILRYVNCALNVRLLAAGHERVFVTTSLVCFAVNVIGNLVFIPIFSWRAAAVITIVTELALLGQNMYWLRAAIGVVPRPFGLVRTSLVFVALLFLSLGGAKIFPPLLVGTLCVLLFLAYLYRTGMIGEFAAAWGAGRETVRA